MQILFDAMVKYASTALVTAVGGIIMANLKAFEKKLSANGNGTKVLLKAKLAEYHKRYFETGDGFIKRTDYQMCQDVYEAYRRMGGNGVGKKEWEDIKSLRIKE